MRILGLTYKLEAYRRLGISDDRSLCEREVNSTGTPKASATVKPIKPETIGEYWEYCDRRD